MVVLCVATLWVTTKNAPFSDRNKSFQTFLKTFEIASSEKLKTGFAVYTKKNAAIRDRIPITASQA